MPLKRFHAVASLCALMGVIGPLQPAAAAPSNSVTIKELSGTAQNNRPFTISRVFARGEISGYPQARVNGAAVTTQADVKTRWPDGSVQHALISFRASLGAGSTITVDFVNQSTGNNTGALTVADMLSSAYDFGAQIEATQGTSTVTANARAMLQAGSFRYWLQGPVCTQVIIEDRTPALSHDMGWGGAKPLHPIFVATFYPGTRAVKVEMILENMWTTKASDQTYSLALKVGQPLGAAPVYTKASYTHIARTRWRRTFWSGGAPGRVNIDYNLPYLVHSKVVPNFDLTKTVSSASVADEVNRFNAGDKGDLGGHGQWEKYMPTAGGRGDIGLFPRWYVKYLYTFDKDLADAMVANAEVSGYIPVHWRESETGRKYNTAGTVDAFGFPLSLDARPLLGSGGSDDIPNTGTRTDGGWRVDVAHQPSLVYLPYILTGDWYFLEELYFWSASNVATPNYTKAGSWGRHESWGYLTQALEMRGTAWGLRTLGHTAFAAPDGSPEKAYFMDKMNNNIAITEGYFNIRNGKFPPADPNCSGYNANTSTDKWCWGRKTLTFNDGRSYENNPIGFAERGDFYATSAAAGLIDTTKASDAPLGRTWMFNYYGLVLGHLKELGLGVDAIQAYVGRFLLNILQNPASSPYLVATYAHPIARASDKLYIDSWAAWKSSFLPTYDAVGMFNSRANDAEHGYTLIAMAAASFLPGLTDGSLSGQSAWDWMKANVPNQSVMNDNPKWAIVPRGGSAAPPPPPPPTSNACDLNSDGSVTSVDVQTAVNQAVGTAACSNGDIDRDGSCSVVDVQRIINASLNGGSCRVGP